MLDTLALVKNAQELAMNYIRSRSIAVWQVSPTKEYVASAKGIEIDCRLLIATAAHKLQNIPATEGALEGVHLAPVEPYHTQRLKGAYPVSSFPARLASLQTIDNHIDVTVPLVVYNHTEPLLNQGS